MTFLELLAQARTMTDAQLKGYALVMSADLRDALLARQAALSGLAVQAFPVALSDGRFFLIADLLGEIGAGGLYSSVFASLDTERLAEVEVLPIADALALLLVAEEEDPA